MASGEELMGLLYRKDPSWYAAGDFRALRVPVGGGEAPQIVPGIFRDIRMSFTAGVLRSGYWR